MKNCNLHTTTAFEAVANMAYKTNEVFPIYPCTPTSEMSALVEQWSAKKRENTLGNVPTAFEMQSEAGVAGAMHGALQVGALSSTFTASQGLLLMIPNMYKIAGELTPNVIHVATRSIATHALSIFGDHSDIMAARQTGYAFLGSASVQEAQDFALISQAATLESRIPFVHFFDGFRTSHETNTIESISDKVIKEMINSDLIKAHKNRALDPNNPFVRGTTQSSDIFFQSREAQNVYYKMCPAIVQDTMDKFNTLTGRQYKIFDYVGHPHAEEVLISMASSTETIEKTIHHLNQRGNKYGLIKVRLFRPFSQKHLLEALPKTVRNIAVIDRTKEPGSSGEPLYLDCVQALVSAYQNNEIEVLPKIIGGRYGLSSKEFTPSMVHSIFNNLKQKQPKNSFTVGITDDITHLSLPMVDHIELDNEIYEAVFYQEKSKINTASFNNLLQYEGGSSYIQGYTQCDYKKSKTRSVSHLRINSSSIKAPYTIEKADYVSCELEDFVLNDTAMEVLKANATLVVNSEKRPREFWQTLPFEKQEFIISKKIKLYLVNLKRLNSIYLVKDYKMNALHACFLFLTGRNVALDQMTGIKEYIQQVNNRYITSENCKVEEVTSNMLLTKLVENRGNELPVSALPVDGTFPSNTSIYNPIFSSDELPIWNPEACTQCGACSMSCPQGALRIKVYDDAYLKEAPRNFKSIKSIDEDFDLLNYTIQINQDQCNSCNNCIDACPLNEALQSKKSSELLKSERENWAHFEVIPEFDREKIDVNTLSQQQLQEPLFKYAPGVEGCGEAPYLKLLSQLYGDRLLVANATGSSSIFGGALPTTPWSKNKNGHGPAWSNSLFEDNAEFGLGFRLGIDQQDDNSQKSIWIVGGDGWAYDIGYRGLDHVLASGKNVNILVLDNEVYDNTGGQMSKATPFGAEAKFAFGGKTKQKKDLGLMAMSYDNVYVASVAIGADQNQTLKAFNEAESFDGPSLIIAYCHSDAHGIDMKSPSRYHKAAVASGQWLLYRNDPRRGYKGLGSLKLDSEAPSIPIEEYLRLESRFQKLFENDKQSLQSLMKEIQDNIDKKFDRYVSLSSNVEKVNF